VSRSHAGWLSVCTRTMLVWTLAYACVALVTVTASAQGAEPHPHVGKLRGFPAVRGVVPVLGSSAAVAAHEHIVNNAFSAARARSSKAPKSTLEPNEKFFAACENEELFFASHNACYRGGPVLRDPTVHLIFWQGQVEEDISKEPNVALFPGRYIETVKRYFEDVAHDSGAQTNVFAVDPQYYDVNGKREAVAGEYALTFTAASDLTVDNAPFPKHTLVECNDENEYAKGPCLLDSDIQKEVEKVAGTSEAGLHDVYLVLTPPGVDGCFGETGCAYKQYCAYHGDFGGDGVTPGKQTLYADLPFVAPDEPFTGPSSGCEAGIHPNSAIDNGADGAIDDASHELNETITDPIGSQCATGATSANQCERNAWTDVIGQEIADKCLPPESTVAGTYGEPLGGFDASTLYNQLINGDHYYTQRMWSNEAGVFEGGCVQRAIGASFSVSAGAAASVPVTFNGSASGAPGDPAVYWVWDFEGEQIGTAGPTTSFTFAQPGQRVVTLTAYDAYGNGEAVAEAVTVGAAPIPSPPAPVPPPTVVKEAASPPAHFTVAQLATKLGLPANARKLSGKGRIALGHGECPPACAITLQLLTKVAVAGHGKRSTKLVQIGTLQLTIAAKGSGALILTLNAKGRSLLHKSRTLACQLQVTVESQEGATWQIVRSLKLTG
jgi:PKD domain